MAAISAMSSTADLLASGTLVPVLSDYRAEDFEINVFYPSRRHLSAKVQVFIDMPVDGFGRQQRFWAGCRLGSVGVIDSRAGMTILSMGQDHPTIRRFDSDLDPDRVFGRHSRPAIAAPNPLYRKGRTYCGLWQKL